MWKDDLTVATKSSLNNRMQQLKQYSSLKLQRVAYATVRQQTFCLQCKGKAQRAHNIAICVCMVAAATSHQLPVFVLGNGQTSKPLSLPCHDCSCSSKKKRSRCFRRLASMHKSQKTRPTSGCGRVSWRLRSRSLWQREPQPWPSLP